MNGINKTTLIGNIGADPQIRYTAAGDAVATVSLATTESWKDAQGQKHERTEWHRLVLWRKLAEIAEQYLKKGGAIYIEGKLQTRKWQAEDGIDRYTTEIIVRELRMLDGRPDTQAAGAAKPAQAPASNQTAQTMPHGHTPPFDDDIPF